MRSMIAVALALAATLGACKKHEAPEAAGSGSAAVAAPVAPPSPPIDAAPAGPWKIPATAKAGDPNADATALGAAVTLHFVEQTQKGSEDGARHAKSLLVLEGGGQAIAADVTTVMQVQDGDAAVGKLPDGAEIVKAPLAPPRAYVDADASAPGVPLEYKQPLLYVVKYAAPTEKRTVIVAQDGASLVTWQMVVGVGGESDATPEWEKLGAIKLAPGAKVTAVGEAAGAAAAPAAAPAAPAGALKPTALDDALAAGGVKRGDIAKRQDNATSQWALVVAKRMDGTTEPVAYTLWRANAAGVTKLDLSPGKDLAAYDDGPELEIRDLDHDGVDDAILKAGWHRNMAEDKGHGHLLNGFEQVQEIYIVGGPKLSLAVHHADGYKVDINLGPEENAQPGESIAFTPTLSDDPPAITIAMGDKTLSKKRIDGLLSVADPLLAPGTFPIKFP